MTTRLSLNWQVGHSPGRSEAPSEWVQAEVPGAVQIDWGRAHGLDPVQAPDPGDYVWMEDAYWTYRAALSMPHLNDGERLWFISKGVDYSFEIRLDGNVLHRQEGMFTPVRVDLTAKAREGAVLEVVVDPAPKSCPNLEDRLAGSREQANQSCKPAMNYGWDFAPHLIPLGICDETYLEVTRPGSVLDAECVAGLSRDLVQGTVECCVKIQPHRSGGVRWTLLDPAGREVARDSADSDIEEPAFRATIDSPELWWPREQGAQPLYTSRVEVLDEEAGLIDARETRVGFRRIRLVENAESNRANDGVAPPITRCLPPMTLEVNGRRIFAKGANWVSPNLYHGAVRPETYTPLLDLVESANMNMLRMWGGSAVTKDAFFDECDRRGILVWQEFPLACNRYEGTPEYLRVLDQESRSIVRRLRSHPCLALWCGGNELFNDWSGMNDQDLAIRLLNRNCFDLDPERPFLPTSPVMGVGHGDYVFLDRSGREPHQIYRQARCSAYCEFGVGSASPVDVLKKIIPAGELFPPKPGAWSLRHGLYTWGEDGWLCRGIVEKVFGRAASIEELVDRSHLLSGEGLKFIFEEARRQKPAASMALMWCFNEPWTSAANSSLVNWPFSPKPTLAEVASACRPSLASARVPKFSWKGAETFEAELWLLNDAPAPVPAGRVEAWLVHPAGEVFMLGWDHPEVPPNENLAGPTARIRLPDGLAGVFELQLRTGDNPPLASRYRFVAKS